MLSCIWVVFRLILAVCGRLDWLKTGCVCRVSSHRRSTWLQLVWTAISLKQLPNNVVSSALHLSGHSRCFLHPYDFWYTTRKIYLFCGSRLQYFHIFRAARRQQRQIANLSLTNATYDNTVLKNNKAAWTIAIIIGLLDSKLDFVVRWSCDEGFL